MNLIPQDSWREVERLFRSTDGDCGLKQTATEGETQVSLLAGLADARVAAVPKQLEQGQSLARGIDGLLQQLATFEQMSRCPILAITGLLNAGKSSLLATYLSPNNRRRVLRGLGNQSGTHRFVLWLPSRWREDGEMLQTLLAFLRSLFGNAAEYLSDDIERAALQYNGHVLPDLIVEEQTPNTPESDPLAVPLVAFDECLNDLQIGLLDCPDIQTGFWEIGKKQVGSEMAEARRKQLSQVGRLCSAFLLVTKMSSLHDEGLLQILTTLRDAMPGVPRILAVNKVKARYAPETVKAETRSLVERFHIASVFVAYDYRSSLAHTRVPAAPPGLIPNTDNSPQPIFFEVTNSEMQANPEGFGGRVLQLRNAFGTKPYASAETNYLHSLGEQLDVGALSRESSRSLVLQLQSRAWEAIQWYQRNAELRQQQLKDGWQAIAMACYDFMAERDASSGRPVGLRLQASPAIVSQMAESLNRTAPTWMRLSLTIDRTARQLQQAVANSTSRFKMMQNASQAVSQFARRFRRGEGAQVVTPERLGEAIRSFDLHDALQAVDGDSLRGCCDAAMKRFAAEDQTMLDSQELDTWSRHVWANMPFTTKLRRGTQPLAIMMAPLLAAVLIPFDGGGSAVLVFASTKELLAAAGIAAVMTPVAAGGEAVGIVQQETPWRQLSDLFALVCDSLGLVRPVGDELPTIHVGASTRRLLPSSLPIKGMMEASPFQQWHVEDSCFNRLQLAVRKLS